MTLFKNQNAAPLATAETSATDNAAPATAEIEIIRESQKGAALLNVAGVEFWVAPAAARAAKEGRLTPAAQTSMQKAKQSGGSPTGGKTACHEIAVNEIIRETDKAVLVKDFNGNSDWLPKSAIVGENYLAQKSDRLIVKAFALSGKSLTYKSKTIWIG